MPAPDLDIAYDIVGRCVLWGGATCASLLILALFLGLSWFCIARWISVLQAKAYIRHWQIICGYMGRSLAGRNKTLVQERLSGALRKAAIAYDEHRLDEPEVRADFALKAFAADVQAYRLFDPAASKWGYDAPEDEDNAKRCEATVAAFSKEQRAEAETAKLPAISQPAQIPAPVIRSAAQTEFTDN